MRSWCLNFFEVINGFEKEPKDDYKYKQINDGECDIHNMFLFYMGIYQANATKNNLYTKAFKSNNYTVNHQNKVSQTKKTLPKWKGLLPKW
jgi:hypothetical protein